ncbi:hypothetical protein PYW08_001295 [Mythimna loreyi]|uniref:Uncharacterized protein n=1 Tax=Mythimna loreyi TaxID=667449 RepID=A0ACC2R2D3_9NEOP|nr:hypothetical protein PYW08_001295 [Mythimna loreyi]
MRSASCFVEGCDRLPLLLAPDQGLYKPRARYRRRRMTPHGHGDALSKHGIPVPCAPPCPPGASHNGNTLASLTHESSAGIYLPNLPCSVTCVIRKVRTP